MTNATRYSSMIHAWILRIDDSAAATAWNMENAITINDDAMTFIEGEGVGVHYLTDDQRAAWVEAMKPVWTELGDGLVGEEVMARLKEIAEVN